MKSRKIIINLLLGPLLFILCCFLLPHNIFDSFAIRSAIGTVSWMAFWWVTAPIDYAITAFLPIAINAIFNITDMTAVISNYSSETILLLLGASILTVSWEYTGLDKRIAVTFLGTVGSNFRKQLLFWFILSALLSSVLPNAVVCATLTPIAVSMLKYIGEDNLSDSKKGAKLLLYIAYGTGVGGLATPLGGAMNLVTIDYLQNITGQEFMYTSWIIRFLPIIIILFVSNIIFMLRNVNKDDELGGSKDYFINLKNSLPKMSKEELISFIMFVLATILSFTRQFYQNLLPGLKPAYAFIICAMFSFLITRADGNRLIVWKSVQLKIGWELMYIFAGGLAAGTLINNSGAAKSIGIIFSNLGLDGGFITVFIIIAITILMSDITSNTATAAIAIPIVISIIQGIEKNPIPYIYIASIGVNLSYMLPTSIRAIPVGYGLKPKYMFKEGWKLTIIVLLLMSITGYLLLRYWNLFSTI